MCQICLDYEKGKLTSREALRNIDEMLGNPKQTPEETEHLLDLADDIETELDSNRETD